jgi:hypothetical protein
MPFKVVCRNDRILLPKPFDNVDFNLFIRPLKIVKMQWAPPNGITDNGINRLMGSNYPD